MIILIAIIKIAQPIKLIGKLIATLLLFILHTLLYITYMHFHAYAYTT